MKLNFRFLTQQKRFGRYKTNPSREEIKISLCFRGIHGRREKTHGEINQVIQIPSTITEQYLFSFSVVKIYIEYFSAVRKDGTRKDTELHSSFIVCLQKGEGWVKELLRTVWLPVLDSTMSYCQSSEMLKRSFQSFYFFFFHFILLSKTYSCWWWNTDY